MLDKVFGQGEAPEYPGLFDKVSPSALIKNPGLFKSFFDRQDVKKQQRLQAEIDAANKAAAEAAARARETQAIQDRINRDPRGYDGSRGPSANPYGGGGGGLHSNYADGGRVYLYNRLK